jgi:hypothetical protein
MDNVTDKISHENLRNLDSSQLKNFLNEICLDLAVRFNLYDLNSKPSNATIVDALAKSSCLICIAENLSNKKRVNNVDTLYRECHRLAVNVLVEELYYTLDQMGYKVAVSTEADLEYGKADVLITVTNYGLNLKDKTKELLVEVKTGNSLSLSQLFRYLLDSKSGAIVVWRVRKRQVLAFNAQIIKPLLTEFTRMICLRGIRLLLSPQLQPCQHVKQSNYLPTQHELQEMFKDFSEALIETLPYAIETILRELDVASSKDTGRNQVE